jgi:predicted nucleotidyltransferase
MRACPFRVGTARPSVAPETNTAFASLKANPVYFPAMVPPALDAIVQRLAAQPEVVRVILFGSRARGDSGPRSDIDLAIEAPNATRRQWLDWEARIEAGDTLLRIDVLRWDEASSAMRQRIAAEGQVLYDRTQARRQLDQPVTGARSPA